VIYKQSLAWLKAALAESDPAKTVVITHHAPSDRSIPPQYTTDILSAAYASNLEDFIRTAGPNLWFHGHTHHSWDYTIGSTRVCCNPRGYPDESPILNWGQGYC
jgi:Icc-related predicted phosphoesterase